MNKLKQWLKSKTIWWNTVGMPTTIYMLDLASKNIDLVADNLGASYGVVAFTLIMVPNYLRSITNEALEDK